MRAIALFGLGLLLLAAPVAAQDVTEQGTGAVLRGLEKVSGDVSDIDMDNGTRAEFGRLRIELGECRYPEGDPVGEAFAFVTIREEGREAPYFSGWMIASAPALNALDHPRYDIWVMRCKTSE